MAARTPLEEKKRQKILLIVLAAVVLVTLIFLYFTVFAKKSKTAIVNPDANTALPGEESTETKVEKKQSTQKQLSSTTLEEKLKKVDLNIDFFNQTILPFLKLNGDLPVKKGETGRLNPFIPY
ncbi:MAG: hypothetical protein PHY37_01390 [Candidatus Portnoybacteria bacterium]|nr:hypothetical protein [Candidatus Portnoybacteria bacterium]